MLNSLARCKPLLGTFVDVTLSGHISNDELITLSNNVFDEIARIHNMMGFHEPSSELSRLNKALLTNTNTAIKMSNEMQKVLELALHLSVQSNGLFDVSIAPTLVIDKQLPNHLHISGTRDFLDLLGNSNNLAINDNYLTNNRPVCIDLGGIAKGFAVDCAIKKIPTGIEFSINAGGDLAISDWKHQQVALQYGKSAKAIKQVNMLASSLATSGDYNHGGNHIIKPKNTNVSSRAKPVKFKGCVSVFSDNTMLADALTKIVVLMKPKQAQAILQKFHAKAIIINRFGFKRVLCT
jgi:thiamine biosynthesis lipoprotein